MNQKTTSLLLSAALVLSLTACGSQTGTESSAASSASAASAASATTEAAGAASAAAAEETEAAAAEAPAASAAEAADSQAETATEDAELLVKIQEANADTEGIFAQYGSMVLTSENVQENVTGTTYVSPEAFIEVDSNGYVLVDEDGQIYGRTSEADEDYFKAACISEADEQSLRTTGISAELLDDTAVITTQDDGTIVAAVTENVDDESRETVADMYGVSAEEVSSFEYRFEIDPDTMLIKRETCSLLYGDMGLLIDDISVEYGGEKPEIPAELDAFLNAEDVRTVTIVTNPGTADEQTMEDTVRRGSGYLIVAQDYDAYTDEACTEPYAADGDNTQDVTVYLQAK